MTTKRAHFSCRCRQHPSQQRDYGHLAKLQTGGDDAASECRQVILEGACDFLNQPVFAKTSQHSRHLPAADRKAVLKIPVAKSRHVGAAIDDHPEKVQVGSGKKAEAAKATVVLAHRTRKFVQVAHGVGRIVEGRYEIQIPTVGRKKAARADPPGCKWGYPPRQVRFYHYTRFAFL